MISILNFFRLVVLFFLCLIFYFFDKNRSVYFFLKLSGPSFIKLGQVLSVRPDLVGKDLSKILSVFQDSLTPFCAKKVKKILLQEFGQAKESFFIDFDFKPVASASIAQVHKAKLQNGQFVAVKIMRPRIKKIMMRDISTLKFIVKISAIFSEFFARSLFDILKLLQETSKNELDFLNEAANASRLKEDLKGVKGFYVPQIFWQFSTEKILVLEWLDGIPFSDIEAISNSSFDKTKIAQNLVNSYFKQVYDNGFFHADMHPGNLFLLKNGDIGVVDFGIMGKIDKKTRLAIAEIFIGFLNKNYQKVAQLHIEANLVPPNTNLDDLALSCRKIGELVVGCDVKDISAATLLENLIKMTRDYKTEARPEILLLQKTIFLVEGVGVSLNPNLNIWNLARPWIKDWAKKNIGFDAKIRDSLLELLELAKNFIKNTRN